LYEGGIRVPLLIKWPGVTEAGSVCNEPVTTCDFYPTLLEILAIPGDSTHNAKVEGMSLVPLLQKTAMRLKSDSLYFHYPHYYPTTTPVRSIRSRDWKLLEYYEDGRLELYNLADDLSESNNLAKQNPEKTAELQKDLHRWLNKNDAQIPVENLNHKSK
jgi:arylsulfatase A-like enzyme